MGFSHRKTRGKFVGLLTGNLQENNKCQWRFLPERDRRVFMLFPARTSYCFVGAGIMSRNVRKTSRITKLDFLRGLRIRQLNRNYTIGQEIRLN